MKVFVALNYNGYPIGIVLSNSRRLAEAYWHGADVIPHSVNVFDQNNLIDHPTGVIPILKVKEIGEQFSDKKTLQIQKG